MKYKHVVSRYMTMPQAINSRNRGSIPGREFFSFTKAPRQCPNKTFIQQVSVEFSQEVTRPGSKTDNLLLFRLRMSLAIYLQLHVPLPRKKDKFTYYLRIVTSRV
jgi:hypothetical protein